MLIFILPLIFILFLIILKIRLKFYNVVKRFPGPRRFPIFGNIHNFIKRNDKDVLIMLVDWRRKYGKNYIFHIFERPYLVVHCPKLAEFVLGSNKLIDKSPEYRFFADWFGQGLLTSTGTKWKSHRKILTPSFHYKILDEFIKVFDKQSTTLIKKLKCEVGKRSFDIFKPISLCTLDIICETALGTEVNAQEDPNSPFVLGVRELCSILYTRCFSPLRFNWIYYLSKTYQKEKRVVKILRNFSEGIIKRRKEAIAKEADGFEDAEDEFGFRKKYTFLDSLLRSTINGQPIPDDDIREEVDTFMFEGHDTTSVAISFILYRLSINQQIQDKVYQELLKIYGKEKLSESTMDKLQQLKYLDLVIKEGLRLYPPASAIAREVCEDIEYDGIILPKGTVLGFCIYSLHRDPELYHDPEEFIPERFTVENQAKRHPYAYLPFSAGPRNCIGQKFAMLELKCTLSKILRNYEVLPADPFHVVEPMIRVTLESGNGIKIQLKAR